LHLSEYANLHPDILSIQSYPHGPHHDCHWIESKLLGRGECNAVDASVLFANKYFSSWGCGIPLKTFLLFVAVWDFQGMIYDEILGIMSCASNSNFYSLTSCKPRSKYIPNTGINGEGFAKWDFKIPLLFTNEVVAYKILKTPKLYEEISYVVTPFIDFKNISCE